MHFSYTVSHSWIFRANENLHPKWIEFDIKWHHISLSNKGYPKSTGPDWHFNLLRKFVSSVQFLLFAFWTDGRTYDRMDGRRLICIRNTRSGATRRVIVPSLIRHVLPLDRDKNNITTIRPSSPIPNHIPSARPPADDSLQFFQRFCFDSLRYWNSFSFASKTWTQALELLILLVGGWLVERSTINRTSVEWCQHLLLLSISLRDCIE